MNTSPQTTSDAPWRLIAGIPFLLLLIAGIILLAKPHSQISASKGNLNVVAAESPWGDIASQIGGDHVHVTSIITNPNVDPHLYESSARDAETVSSADIVIVNGLGYDDFMSRLLSTSRGNQQLLTASRILDITGKGANRHLWYDIPRVNEVASKIANSFAAKDPNHAADYERNLKVFVQSLNPLLRSINRIRRQYGGVPVAYTEPVPRYLLQAARLDIKTPEGFAKSIEDGDDPNPADTQAIDTLITDRQIRVLLYNAQTTNPVTERLKGLARQVRIPVISVTETLPPNDHSYQEWQQDQIDQLLKALQTTR